MQGVSIAQDYKRIGYISTGFDGYEILEHSLMNDKYVFVKYNGRSDKKTRTILASGSFAYVYYNVAKFEKNREENLLFWQLWHYYNDVIIPYKIKRKVDGREAS